jgi:uncharacterized delta-60 repeat protein
MREETLSFGITNNTNGLVPVSLFGNDSNISDNANVTTRYYWDVTAYTYDGSSNISLEVTSGGTTTTINTVYYGQNLQGVINALNLLGYGSFFLTTSGGSTFINIYPNENTFGNLTIGLSSIFNSNFAVLGFNGLVSAIAIQSDGKVILGGAFTTYNGNSYGRIVRLNANGTEDTSFNSGGTGFDGAVNDILIQPDGKIVCVGSFTFYTDISGIKTSNGIARLNSDGTWDIGYGTGFDSSATKIIYTSTNQLVVVGGFTTFRSNSSVGVCRINLVGSYDATFNVGTGIAGGGITANSVVEQTDGKFIVVGDFTSYNGNTANYIVRVSSTGTYDATFLTSLDDICNDVALQSDGRIIIVGDFLAILNNTEAVERIARLSTIGNIDLNFNNNISDSGFDNSASRCVVLSNDKILVGGSFTTYFNGFDTTTTSANRIIRLNSSGTIDTTWNYGTAFNSSVVEITANSTESLIYVGGTFTSFDGNACVNACSLYL